MTTFHELGLNPALLQAIEKLGFTEPTQVQAEVIPVLLQQPTDLVGLAKTGTGKTAAFGLPILQDIRAEQHHTQAVILCPTRELCMQITRDLNNYAGFLPELKIVAVYGGASIETQIRQLQTNPHIIVGTPGRMKDMLRRNKIDLSGIRWVVLDEADEMLDMGFQEEVDAILQTMPADKQTLLFSATMPDQVEHTLNKYMYKPVIKSIGQKNTGTANVKHIYYMVHAKDRYLALKRIADYHPDIYAIVFCRTRKETQEIADMLIRDGYNVDALHGDLSQAQRDHVMNRFRNRNLQLLVATDVAARGLDVQNLSHVINYNLPDEADIYLHRSGRTGRADKTGVCISIINLKEKGKIKFIERTIGREFARAKIPTGVQVCEKQLFHHIDRMEKVQLNHEEIDSFLPVIYRKLEWMNREEIIKRFVAIEFNRFLDYYRDAIDLNVQDNIEKRAKSQLTRSGSFKEGNQKSKSFAPSTEEGFTRMAIQLGRKDRATPQQIIGLINEYTRSRNIRIGRIDILDRFSYVDVDTDAVDLILDSFANPRRNKRKLQIHLQEDNKFYAKDRSKSGKTNQKKETGKRSSQASNKQKRFPY